MRAMFQVENYICFFPLPTGESCGEVSKQQTPRKDTSVFITWIHESNDVSRNCKMAQIIGGFL